jgi:hypothetical protein
LRTDDNEPKHPVPQTNRNSRLFADVCHIIEDVRRRVTITVNTEICLLYWHVGSRIKTDVLHEKRAGYGKLVIKKLAENLTGKYGRGWSFQTLQHCVRAAYTFSEDEIAYAVRTQLTWTHLRSLMSIDDKLKRAFYSKRHK